MEVPVSAAVAKRKFFPINYKIIYLFSFYKDMNKKLIFTSLATCAIFAACTSEELAPQTNEVADVFATRPKIDVKLTVDSPITRMTGDGASVKFDTKDHLGAVLVDQGNADPAHYYDLMTENSHIGNNKFYYEAPHFVTDGTMCVGAWLFYANYSEVNTTNRGAIQYSFPVIQNYSKSDYTEMAKHDFKFSPIVNLTGFEDGKFTNFSIPTISAFTYANVKLAFDKEVSVQKVVIKPFDPAITTGVNYTSFSDTYELSNSGLAEAVADLQNATLVNTGATRSRTSNCSALRLNLLFRQ